MGSHIEELNLPSFTRSEVSPSVPNGATLQILRHLGRLYDVTHELLCVIDFDGHPLFLNSSWEIVLGYSREELMAKSPFAHAHPDDLVATLADARKVMAGVASTSFENRLQCRDGSYRWFSWSAGASIPERVVYVAGRDITEQKRSDGRIVELARALDDNCDMISIGSPDGHAVFVNGALLQATGYQPDDLVGRPYSKTLLSSSNPPGLYEEFQARVSREGSWSGECSLCRKDGSDFPVLLSISVLRDDEGHVTGRLAIARDITELKRLENRTLQLAQALENNPEMICLADEQGHATYVNHALLHVSGYREEDILGKTFNESLFSPSNPPALDGEIRARVASDGRWSGECLQRCKDGRDIPVSLTVGAIRNGEGGVTSKFAIAQDVTERQRLERQLRHAQKMEAVGQLAGGIAHDFNNLLMVITGYAGNVADQLDAHSPLRQQVAQITKAGQRAASLTRQLLAFSRRQPLEPALLSPNSVIGDLQEMLRRLINEDIELVTVLDPEAGHIRADLGQIEQVIVNLVVNARDAMPRGGRITIETQNVEVSETLARQHPPMTGGSFVRLAVTDTGVGMDATTQSRIFEPFFTTKEQGKGTGLGLATVYGAVKQSGGFIWVTSQVGSGTKFDIFLPRIADDTPANPPDAEPSRIQE